MKEQDEFRIEEVRTDRRTFLKGAVVAGSALAAGTVGFPNLVKMQNTVTQPRQIPLPGNSSGPARAIAGTSRQMTGQCIGGASKNLKPIVEIEPGDFIFWNA